MSASVTEDKSDPVTAFLSTPLVQWVQLILNRDNLEIEDLVDGVALNEIMLQIDPRPVNSKARKNKVNDVNGNVQNLSLLLRHIKSFYEELQKQVVIMEPPNLLMIIKSFKSSDGLAELEKLLLLIMGCAVQCDHREKFIEKMKQLTYEGMEIMMNHIKDITENTNNILNLQWDELNAASPDQMRQFLQRMSDHIYSVVTQRDKYHMINTDVSLERDYLQSQTGSPSRRESFTGPASRQHLIVELNDLKAKYRKSRQELDEKMETVSDLKQELTDSQNMIQTLKQENESLSSDARCVRALRDENDILKEKAAKASRLEFESDMLKEKLKDVDFYRQRVEEIREDNRILHETKSLLEEQLESTRTRLDGLVDAEKKIIELKQQLNDALQEGEKDKVQIQELMEVNSNLEFDKMQSMNESGNLAYQLEQARGNAATDHLSIKAESEESIFTRALRLEKENKHLQALVSTYKDAVKSSEITEASMLHMEKENSRLSGKLQQLQEHINKEKQSVMNFEQLSEELTAERKRLEVALKTTQSTAERRIEEVTAENTQLNKTIASLRERSKIGGDAKVKAIEKENKALSELAKDLNTKLSKSEHQAKELQEKLLSIKVEIEQVEALDKENAKLEKQNIELVKSLKQQEIACENMSQIEQRATELEVENKSLANQVTKLKALTERFNTLQDDKRMTDQEASRLKRQVESWKKACGRLAELEQDKLEAENKADRLQQSLETMKASAKTTEKLEAIQVELENELERVRSQLEVTKQRLSARENDVYDMERSKLKVISELNQAQLALKKMEMYSTDNQKLVENVTDMKYDIGKQRKEIEHLKQQLETKTSDLDQSVDEVRSLSSQNKALRMVEEQLQKSRLEHHEAELRLKRLCEQQAMDKRTLSELREEFVNEKLACQQKQVELEKLHTELNAIGINKEELLQLSANIDMGDKKFSELESRFESTFKKAVEVKEKQIASLEARLGESVNLNSKLRQDIKSLRHDYESLSQRHQEEVLSSQPLSSKGSGFAAKEMLESKDRLISVERKNAALLAENASNKSVVQDLQSHVRSLQSQVNTTQRQQEKTLEGNEMLQRQCAKLQVENSTLQSQCSSLMSQNAQSVSAHGNLETENRELSSQLTKSLADNKHLEKDHDDLHVLHERQTVELENLVQDHQKLKQLYRQAKLDLKSLQENHDSAMKKNSADKLSKENESNHAFGNFEALKDAHERLSKSYKNLNNEYEDLQSSYASLKTNHNQMKLEYAKLEAESSDIKDHNQQLDITAAKLNNRCEVLMQLKANLEEENRHLLEQISRLMSQNEELLSQTLESKDQIYSEQKQYTERMQEIRRQKEKLEEKIMDLYRTPGHSPAKRKGLGATIKKTIQNFGKSGESRRRRDGLPTSAASLTPHSDQQSLRKADSTSDIGLSVHNIPNSASVESPGSQWSPDLGRTEPASVNPDNSRSDPREKRRHKLGGSLAYSTNALHTFSAQNVSKSFKDTTMFQAALTPPPSERSYSGSAADGHSLSDAKHLATRDDSDILSNKERPSWQQRLQSSDGRKSQIEDVSNRAQDVVMRPRSNTKPRPKSMSAKGSGSFLSVASDSPSAVQRLDSLVGSPRSKDSPIVQVKTPSKDGAPKPAPRSISTSSPAVELPITPNAQSTPLNKTLDRHSLRYSGDVTAPSPATNPDRGELTGHSPTRRDVPPDVDTYRAHSSGSRLSQRNSATRSPANDNDPDKATQWYEYGCV